MLVSAALLDESAIIDMPLWARTPTASEIDAAFPDSKRRVDANTVVRFDCRLQADGSLSACRTLKAVSRDAAFEEAAKSLTPRFKSVPSSFHWPGDENARSPGEWRAGDHVIVSVDFIVSRQPLESPPTGESELRETDVALTRRAAMEAQDYYPEAALRNGREGSVKLHCRVESNGSLRACHADPTQPVDRDLSEGAVAEAGLLHVGPLTRGGEATVGRALAVRITFKVSQ